MLPRVVINVNEVPYQNNVPITYTPAFILKTLSGPIGEANVVTTYDEFVSIYGVPTKETPVAYALGEYLKEYQRVYVTRLASEDAICADATAILLDANGEPVLDNSEEVKLFTAKSVYKTDVFNGNKIELKYDDKGHTIYIVGEIYGKMYSTVRQGIVLADADAVEYEKALNVIIESFNKLETGIVLEQEYKGKIAGNAVPQSSDQIYAIMNNGSSGLGTVDFSSTDLDKLTVKKALNLYNTVEITINSITFPEFTTYDSVVEAVRLGDERRFFVLTSPKAENTGEIEGIISQYPNSQHLVNYLDECYLEDPEILVPSCMAAQFAWGATYAIGPYLAPAGITRATLNHVTKLRKNWSYDEVDYLYNFRVPVNPIEYKPARGYVLWGQKTSAPDNIYSGRVDGAALIDYVVLQLDNISQPFLFESITANTFARWTLDATSILTPLVNAQVITPNFQVIMDSTNNTQETVANNQLIGAVVIQKVGVAEEVIVNFSVTREG